MLVLSRRLGEMIVVEANIQIVVVEIQRNGVRLGISAPPSVRVDRKEIQMRRSVEWPEEGAEADN